MSIAAEFNRKMDVVLDAADLSQHEFRVARRAAVARAIDEAGLVLTTKAAVEALMEKANAD